MDQLTSANLAAGTPGAGRYVNREYSWLQFNRRVLAEAENPDNPLLERIKFLAIFESNLDEFYMVRVSGLVEQEASGIDLRTPDGMDAAAQLQMVSDVAREARRHAADVWSGMVRPALEREGLVIARYEDLAEDARADLGRFFQRELFPVLTPLMLRPSVTFPFISNRSLNLAVELRDGEVTKWARVKVPTVVGRLVPLPGRRHEYVMLEDVVAAHLGALFPGVMVGRAYLFRVVRDADIEIRELEAADLIDAVEETLRRRRFGDPVLLEVEAGMPDECLELLTDGLELDEDDVFTVDGMVGMEFLWELARADRPDLKFPPLRPYRSERLSEASTLFSAVREGDVLLHHPYDSFDAVETFVGAAAEDPAVVGIKQTLYRVGSESPIVESLSAAAEAGKQAAVMVELKARFDESNNLVWSRALERAGVHLTYGMLDMKVHCKLCLVVRKDEDGIRTYAHIGTGNYNPSTAKLYTDLGLFTCDAEVCQDVTELFNYLTGFSKQSSYRKLLVAPLNLREGIIERIERETELAKETGRGRVAFKLNSLVDTEVIDALYAASQAGVQVDLVVRGICCLRPGVPGLSESIRVRSVVGRFLEHSRVYYFENGGAEEALIGSADMMRRNLDRRIEALVPVVEPKMVAYLRDDVIGLGLTDTKKAWEGLPDGHYRRVEVTGQERNSQDEMMSRPAEKVLAPEVEGRRRRRRAR